MSGIKNVILLGSGQQELQQLQHQIHNLGGAICTAVTDIRSITELLHRQRADLIILYAANDEGIYADYVHTIRRNRLADEVALVVCRQPLDAETLEEVLRIK